MLPANGAVQSPDIELAGRSWGPAETRDTRNAGWDPGIAGDRIFAPDPALFSLGLPLSVSGPPEAKKSHPAMGNGTPAFGIFQTGFRAIRPDGPRAGVGDRLMGIEPNVLGRIPRLAFRRSGERHRPAHKLDPLRRTGGGDRCSERKRNHQHPTSARQTAAVLNSNTANEVPRTSGIRIATPRNQPRSVRPERELAFHDSWKM